MTEKVSSAHTMKIKKLEIYGFKTFPHPTEIAFHDGVTTVVGPNGCGKSNIIDALRWVMGEKSAKGLRGDSMSDVIFNGCDSRKPLNFAEVTLTLTEVEGKLPEKFGNLHELAVTRRLHRTGESEYLINKIACRLRDITDLFLDTGLGRRAYSIIEQGRIDAILSAKPIDRRFLIEEAAGLSKYRARRDEALNKMRRTGENLERITDIIGEVRREMNSLKRQASKARAFKGLRGEKRELERNLMVSAWLELNEGHSGATKQVEEINSELEASTSAGEKIGLDLERYKLSLVEREKTIEESRRGVYGLKNQITEREHRVIFLESESESLAGRSHSSKEEAEELGKRAGEMSTEVAEAQTQKTELDEKLRHHQSQTEKLEIDHRAAIEERRRSETAVEEHRKQSFTTMQELSSTNNSIEHAFRQERQARARFEGLEAQEESLAGKIREVESESQGKETDLNAAQKAVVMAVEERARLEEDIEDLSFERESQAARVTEVTRELHTEESRLQGLNELKESLEWYGSGVKAILKHASDEQWIGVRGVVADTISVPSRFEAALEAALGERLQYVVVADSAQALEGVAHLKQSKEGRSSFVPVDLKDLGEVKMPDTKEQWAHGSLMELVKVEPGYERLARALLGGFYVVDSLDNATELWTRNGTRATFVTLDGETLTPEGVFTGGETSGEDAGLLSRNRQIRELTTSVSKLKKQLSQAEQKAQEATNNHEEVKQRLEFVRDEVHRQELKVAHVSKDMAQFQERRDRLEERRQALEFERDDLDTELKRLATEGEELELRKAELLRIVEGGQEAEQELKGALEKAVAEAERLGAELNGLRVVLAEDRQRVGGLAQQIRTLNQSRQSVIERCERLKNDAGELMAQHGARIEERGKLQLELEALRVELGRKESKSKGEDVELDRQRSDVSQQEKAAAEIRRRSESIRQRLSEAEMKVRELELQGENLTQRFSEKLDGTILEAVEEGVGEEFDLDAAAGRIEVLENRLRSFGELNLLADDEYEERKTRYDFLETQRKDLEESLDALKRAIQRINRISRERFSDTFAKVDAKFREIYPLLFRGGQARLFLTEPENILETGIDITAQPPGKKPQHISLLSGGEKALTAVALIFSLFMVKPSPFCVLDEVDAPLDDTNVERFTELLTEMAASSQFLVITHNKITMEAGDHLYGVTMEDPGISNLVSVRLGGSSQRIKAV